MACRGLRATFSFPQYDAAPNRRLLPSIGVAVMDGRHPKRKRPASNRASTAAQRNDNAQGAAGGNGAAKPRGKPKFRVKFKRARKIEEAQQRAKEVADLEKRI